jgi:hypothetical protein
MRDFLDALNRPADAFRRRNRVLAWGLVAATVLVVVIVDPLLGLVVNGFEPPIWSVKTLILLLSGAMSYTAVSAGFYLICRALGCKTTLGEFLNTWGLTYLPTLACAIVVSFVENFFYLFWGNALLGMVFNLVFCGILIWKSVLYALFLRNVAGLQGKRFWGAFAACGVIVLIMAFANMQRGSKPQFYSGSVSPMR